MESTKEDNGDLLDKLLPKHFHLQAAKEEGEESHIHVLKWMKGTIRRRKLVLISMLMLVTAFVVVGSIIRERGVAAKRKAAVISLIQARSPPTTFDDVTSPQRRALDWLLSDGYSLKKLLFDNCDRIVQRFALAVIYHANGGSEWQYAGRWLDASKECGWRSANGGGLHCCHSNHVTSVNLLAVGPRGSLPRELGLLSHLTSLDLGGISGAIPSEIGLLTSLRYLRILSGRLEAPFPTEIGMLTRLTLLNVIGNKNLTGRVPTELGNLSSLRMMFFDGNQLTGSIPFPCHDTEHTPIIEVDCDKISCGGCCHHDDGRVFRSC